MEHQQTKELISLFSTTVSSIASDASTLEAISSLHIAASFGSKSTKDAELVLDTLRDLDLAVADIEAKVRILQSIAAEEQRALNELEAIKTAAEAQSAVLDHMMEIRQNMIQNQQEKENSRLCRRSSSTIHAAMERKRFDTTPHPKARRIRRDSLDDGQPLLTSPAFRPTVRENSTQMAPIYLSLITTDEYHSVSTNIRGRITLAVVNDSLLDIQRVCNKKYAQLSRQMTPGKELSKVQKEHANVAVVEHGKYPWVSEQDLRQTCAFFRSGESTARAILAILRSLRRIKQVPGRNSEVTYILVSSGPLSQGRQDRRQMSVEQQNSVVRPIVPI